MTGRLAAVYLLLLLVHPAAAHGKTPLPVITTAMAVRKLSIEEATKEYPVRIRAVVTYVNPASNELFVQDASAGIFVFIGHSKSNQPLQTGQLVEINGVSSPGDFCASITKAQIMVLGRAAIPKPVRMPIEQLLTGKEDCQWGELKAVIRSGRVTKGVLYLNAVTTGGAFLVIMQGFQANWQTSLVDAEVTFTGVLAAVFNEHRQVSGVRIFIPGQPFLHIDDPPPASPFDLPRTSALSIGAFRPAGDLSRRGRVRAAVTAVVSNSTIYVSEGEGSLPAELDSPCSAQPGELVDIVGFPGLIDGRPGLKNALCRVVAPHSDVRPLALAVKDVLPSEVQEIGSGLTIAAGTRYDLKLVTLEGALIQWARGLHSQTLTVASLDRNFTVTIPDGMQGFAEALELGSLLRITGVCLIGYDEYRRPQSFRILIRRATDVVVETRPPWWTAKHAFWIVGAMLISVCAAVCWILVLRKHVATKTHQLREANERLHRAAMEDALTGAANRRRFDEMLEIEVSRASRTSAPVSLIMADIDYFKAVNDRYGHQSGDQCLIKVSRALRDAASRSTDVLARFGGEEFAVILPNTGNDAAAALAESMRQAVEDLAIPHEVSPFKGQLSISLGVGTLWPGSTYSPELLIEIADRALYQAKQSGRNCVVTPRTIAMSANFPEAQAILVN